MTADPLEDPTPETVDVIAVRGKDRYLLVPAGTDPCDLTGVDGRMLDGDTGELGPVMPALSPIRHGYWQEFEGSDTEVERLLSAAHPVDLADESTTPDGEPDSQ